MKILLILLTFLYLDLESLNAKTNTTKNMKKDYQSLHLPIGVAKKINQPSNKNPIPKRGPSSAKRKNNTFWENLSHSVDNGLKKWKELFQK